MHIYAYLVDDMQDDGHFRHGKPCWHRLEGEVAKVDASALQSGMFATLTKHFRDQPDLSVILEKFHEVSVGKCLIQWSVHDMGRRGQCNWHKIEVHKDT